MITLSLPLPPRGRGLGWGGSPKGRKSMKSMKFDTMFGNDKNWVIMAVFGLGICSLIILKTDAKEIITNAISGLMGIAVGYGLTKN